MQSILNAEPSPPPPPPAPQQQTTPVRSSGQSYDPIRSSTYDPVRETMLARDPYGTGPLSSPGPPVQPAAKPTRASPSIASLVDPPVAILRSPAAAPPPPPPPPPQQTYANIAPQPRFHDAGAPRVPALIPACHHPQQLSGGPKIGHHGDQAASAAAAAACPDRHQGSGLGLGRLRLRRQRQRPPPRPLLPAPPLLPPASPCLSRMLP